MTNSLPEAQKLYERFKGDDRVRVVAVATAFEKETYPWMADEAQIKSRLTREGWKFPVMRDKDERTVRTLGFNGRYGTPTTLVIDAQGVVRWHGFNTQKKTSRQVEAKVDALLESFYVAAIPSFPKELKGSGKAYRARRYGKAYSSAQKVLAKEETPTEVKTLAQQIITNIDAGLSRLTLGSAKRRSEGYPRDARTQLETATRVFKGVPGAVAARSALSTLKKDATFKREIKAEKELMKITAMLAQPNAPRQTLLTKLEELAKEYSDTPVAARIRAAAK